MELKSFNVVGKPRAQGFALAAMTLACACFAAPSAMAAPAWVATATEAFVPDGAKAIGSLPDSTPVHVVLGLTLQHRAELEQLVKNQGTAGNPAYRQFLTPEQFAAHYSPTAAQGKLVTDYLTAAGFRNVTLSSNRLLVSADGTAATARKAFSTDFTQYEFNGRTVFANSKPALVPASLSGVVLSVVGLQNAHEGHTLFHKAGLDATSVGFYPAQFAQLYSANLLPPASTVAVAIFAEGSLSQTLLDLQQFEGLNPQIPAPPVNVIPVNGSSTDTSGTPEWDLDSQDILGMTGGVKSLTFYSGPSLSFSDMNTEFNQIVTDNAEPVINVSIGGCEISAKPSGAEATSDQIFLQGNSQGQTFFISTGDSGSAECGRVPGQSWPAISPYVMAVGGTSLTANPSGNYASESVWVDGGGGPSVTEAKPGYQSGIAGISYNSRGVPDVALDADPNTGSKIIVNGKQAQYGGTSLAAPLMTGVWARLTTAYGVPSLGFATPIFYQLAPTLPTALHDVTTGNNGKYSATAGWDYGSGFGSPVVSVEAGD